MLKLIRLKFGPTPDSDPVQLTPSAMTVIVGPNNSGKSLTLQELDRSLHGAKNDWGDPAWKILADIEPALPPYGEIRARILEATAADLGPIRTDDPSTAAMLTNWAKLAGTPSLDPSLIRQGAYWLGIFQKKGKVDTLVRERKLRVPVDTTNAVSGFPFENLSDFDEAALEDGMKHILEWLKSEERATADLIHTVLGRSDEALIEDGIIDLRGYYKLYKKQCMLLDGKARLELALDERSESLRMPAEGSIMRLWHAPRDLERLRSLVFDAFGQHLSIDILDLGKARFVLSDQKPPPGIEQRLDQEARHFFDTARPLSSYSDGVRTYVGLHAELIAQDRRFIMLDEPEAFLHPPLARRLGFNLSTLAAERGSCVFAATHSPDFLMGCIESGVGVNIVRLGYHNGRASAHLLPRDELQTMMVDPLLRSTGILGALFHQAAVVVEGDSDRAFYSEVNERLRIHEPTTHPAVMRDCVFLNAQGKATVSRILEALRRVGIVSCGIVDLDLLKDAKIAPNLARARGAPDSVCASIGYTRSQIEHSVKNLSDLCKPNGLARASENERKGVEHFIREMEGFGIFLPEVGPVEGWLSSLGVEVRKSSWIAAIFEKMGPVNTGLKPERGDVWQFIRRIGRFLDEQRAPSDPDASRPAPC